MSGNNQLGVFVCCLSIIVIGLAIVYVLYGALSLAIGGAIIIPVVVLLFYLKKNSKQTNHKTPVSVSNDEYEKWKRNALPQKEEKQEQPKEKRESKKEDEDTTTQPEEENQDQSVYDDNPDATQEDDMEEDLALLDDEDMGW